MPRKKEYNREDVLAKATAVFWEKGFEGASMQDLVSATGLNRFSMYDAFENKEGLFKAVLQSYMTQSNCILFDDLRDNPQGLSSINGFYERLFGLLDAGSDMRGCLVLNTAVDSPCRDDAIVEMVNRQYTKSQALFKGCLEVAKTKGEIAPESDTEALAQYLVGVNHAIIVMHRISTPIDKTRTFLDTALQNLNPLVPA